MLKLPQLSQGRCAVGHLRMANVYSVNSNPSVAPAAPDAGPFIGTLAGCSERCFDGWCTQCCPGSGCVGYPDRGRS
jgi:hypothetical protein